jgi:hypothetical protein
MIGPLGVIGNIFVSKKWIAGEQSVESCKRKFLEITAAFFDPSRSLEPRLDKSKAAEA